MCVGGVYRFSPLNPVPAPILLLPGAGLYPLAAPLPLLDVPQVLVLRAKERNSRRAVIIKFSLRCGRGVGLASSH